MELELRGKNERVVRRESKRLIYKLNPRQWRGIDATPHEFF